MYCSIVVREMEEETRKKATVKWPGDAKIWSPLRRSLISKLDQIC